jgi:outer membrane protein TolC
LKFIANFAVLFCVSGLLTSGISQELDRPAQALTLQQAVERALANYPALQIQRYDIEQALGQKTTAGLLPNPVLSYNREDIKLERRRRNLLRRSAVKFSLDPLATNQRGRSTS